MVSVFRRNTFKTIKQKWVRFLVNALIMLTSVSFTAGLGSFSYTFKPSFIRTYHNGNCPDVIVKNTELEGFTIEGENNDIEKIKKIDNVKDVYPTSSMDIEGNNGFTRIHMMDLSKENIMAKPVLIDGEEIKEEEIVDELIIQGWILRKLDGTSSYEVGDVAEVDLISFIPEEVRKEIPDLSFKLKIRVVGICESPLYNSTIRERALTTKVGENYVIDTFFTTPTSYGELGPYLPVTDLYVTMNKRSEYYTSSYEKESNALRNQIVELFGKKEDTEEDKVIGLTLEQNTSYAAFDLYDNKVTVIGFIIPLLFVAVCALVQVIIIGRLFNEDRTIIGCCFSLGVRRRQIVEKYLTFTLLSTLIGGIAGYFLGVFLIPRVVEKAYTNVFRLSNIVPSIFSPSGLMMLVFLIAMTLIVTIITALKCLNEVPNDLLKAKAPKEGKPILLEKVKPLWNHMSFNLKSNVRNIFRHKKNLILTSLSVIGSMILVFMGFSLRDSTSYLANDYTSAFHTLAPSMQPVSIVVVGFGVIMCMLVVYALSSMNVDDRVREIAVLKVLGYYDRETAFYAMRELLIIAIVSGIIGLPISMLVSSILLNYLNFGQLSYVSWYSYVLTYVLIIFATLLSCLMLYPKIKKVDFNVSLKSIE